MKKEKINVYLVTVRGGVCFDVYAANVVFNDLMAIFTKKNKRVAVFDIHDLVDVSILLKSSDNNLFKSLYEMKTTSDDDIFLE